MKRRIQQDVKTQIHEPQSVGMRERGFVRCFERFSPDYYLPLSDHSPVFVDVEL